MKFIFISTSYTMWGRDDTDALNAIANASTSTKNKLEAILMQYGDALDGKIQSVERAYGQQNIDIEALREEAEGQGDSVVPYRLAALEVQKMFDMLRSDDGELSIEYKARNKRHLALVAHQEDLQKISSVLGMRRRKMNNQEVSFLTDEELGQCLLMEQRRFDAGQQEGAAALRCVWDKLSREVVVAEQSVWSGEETRTGMCLCSACVKLSTDKLDTLLQQAYAHKHKTTDEVCGILGRSANSSLPAHERVPQHYAQQLATALSDDLVARLDEVELVENLYCLRDSVSLLEQYLYTSAPPTKPSYTSTEVSDTLSYVGLHTLDTHAWASRSRMAEASGMPRTSPAAPLSESNPDEATPRLLVDSLMLLVQLFEVHLKSVSAQRALSHALKVREAMAQTSTQVRMLKVLGGQEYL